MKNEYSSVCFWINKINCRAQRIWLGRTPGSSPFSQIPLQIFTLIPVWVPVWPFINLHLLLVKPLFVDLDSCFGPHPAEGKKETSFYLALAWARWFRANTGWLLKITVLALRIIYLFSPYIPQSRRCPKTWCCQHYACYNKSIDCMINSMESRDLFKFAYLPAYHQRDWMEKKLYIVHISIVAELFCSVFLLLVCNFFIKSCNVFLFYLLLGVFCPSRRQKVKHLRRAILIGVHPFSIVFLCSFILDIKNVFQFPWLMFFRKYTLFIIKMVCIFILVENGFKMTIL